MTTHPNYLEIHVHSVDGHMAAFVQQGAEAVQKLIAQMQPGRVFRQPFLAVAGQGSLSVFPAATVVRVDLVMRGFPDWPFHLGFRDAMELSEDEFRERISLNDCSREPLRGPAPIYADIEMTNGEGLYLQMEVDDRDEPVMQVEFGMLIERFLSASSLHARRVGGGALVINPAQILRVQLRPAPPHPPLNAWSAEPLADLIAA